MAMSLAICQVFIANLANNTALIGVYQGSYGIGGITGPLIATALVSKGNIWSRFYAIELGIAALNLAASGWAFWDSERESSPIIPRSAAGSNLQGSHSHNVRNMTDLIGRKWRSFKNLLSNRPTVLGALFMFSYQGAEVAISGWVISFLVQFRHGDPSKVGYVTSGFWAGINLGLYSSQDSQAAANRTLSYFRKIHTLVLSPLHRRAPLRSHSHRGST
jgi:fucose permease